MTEQRSYFDLPEESTTFWKQRLINDFSGLPKQLESEFFIRNRRDSSGWESCTLFLQKNFLVCQTNSQAYEVDYIDLDEQTYAFKVLLPHESLYTSTYPHAFQLYSNGKSFTFYCKQKVQIKKWVPVFMKFCVLTDFHERYNVLDLLGAGGCGQVYLLEDKVTKMKRAGKLIKFSESKEFKAEHIRMMIFNEIKLLRKLDHPNILRMHELYEMDNKIWIVMEYIQGGSLFTRIKETKKMSEKECAVIMKQVFTILLQLESMDIIHRDIKLENLMLTYNKLGKPVVKLIDFGLGVFHHSTDRISKCGTAGYIAPEILNNEPYDFKSDLYSAGIVMYTCLTGKPLFSGRNYKELLQNNKKGILMLNDLTYNRLSVDAKNLLQKLLERFPSSRISLEGAINHSWFQGNLTLDDRKDFVEQSFKIIQMNIPDDKQISCVPSSRGQLSKSNPSLDCPIFRPCAESLLHITDTQSNNQEEQPPRLNSFYMLGAVKKYSASIENLESIRSRAFLNSPVRPTSHMHLQLNNKSSDSKQFNFVQEDKFRFDDSTAKTPAFKNYRLPTDTDEEGSVANYHLEEPEDEGSTCGDRYSSLVQTRFCFETFQKFRALQTANASRNIDCLH